MLPTRFGIVGILLVTSAAAAEPTAQDTDVAMSVGGELRSEWGVHPLRIHAGVEVGRLVRPSSSIHCSGRTGDTSFDVLGTWRLSPSGWSAMAGWRPSGLQLGSGIQFQHGLLVGVIGPLPRLGPVSMSWGV